MISSLDDKTILNDCLAVQKQSTGLYNMWANECVNLNLRDEFLCILREEHEIQSDIFSEMERRGFYPVVSAEQTKVDQARTKFMPMRGNL